MRNFDKRIIVGGLPRSGSTLFRLLLNASSCIVSGPETAFFTLPLHQQQLRSNRIVPKLGRKLDIDESVLHQAIHESNSSFEAFDRIMDIYASDADANKSCWAEKSPRNCFAYHWLAAENPDAYFISTIRHGLDVVTSVIRNHLKRGNEYWCPIQRYVDTMLAIYALKHPNHLIIKYENLVKNPRGELKKVFRFLGLPFEEHILDVFNRKSKTVDFSRMNQPKLKQTIKTSWIGRWQNKGYSERVKEFFEHPEAPNWLEKSGYSA